MNVRAGIVRIPLLGSLLLAPPPLPAAEPAKKDILLEQCLVLPPVGHYGRGPIHTDALEAAVVAGTWRAPKDGDVVAGPDGPRTWKAVRAKDGALDHEALRGGYLYWHVPSDAARVVLLEASGHTFCSINGEPRAGDPYQNGLLRLPVRLRAGANDLLFHCGRGHLNARLSTPPAPAFLDTRDVTAPDFRDGDDRHAWAALVVINADDRPLEEVALTAGIGSQAPLRTLAAPIPAFSARKVPFRVPPPPGGSSETIAVDITLHGRHDGQVRTLDRTKLTLRRRQSDQAYKRTFLSEIDGSVQYYAIRPARPDSHEPQPGLILSLHGAAVEAMGQAECYSAKTWAHVVAPTNRRPYGFDWEDWGRLDALEVLEHARKELHTDPRRTWLTGHSMGGHGTWHLGVTFPDRFAAIGPSAGWVSFWSYAGARRPDKPTAVQAMLLRAASPSDTNTLLPNSAATGVYVLHGDVDDNVPVAQARFMRRRLGEFHPNFAYYERPGAGHWWGNECMDWPPLIEFLSRHTLPKQGEVPRVDFVTASPGVSPQCHWARVEAQLHSLELSAVHLRLDADRRRFTGTTDNVARLSLDLAGLKPGAAVTVELDGQPLPAAPWPAGPPRLWLRREGGRWSVSGPPRATAKGPQRYGPFKDVFRNRVQLVYGTHGTAAENAWAFAKARFDAETFWYRGNGILEVVPDTAFDPAKEPDRNVVLYGHAEANSAYTALLGSSPVQVRRGAVRIGERSEKGEDLACLFVRPRPGSDTALVGLVVGTGPAGMRLTDRLPYFVSGCAYPDCLVLGPETLMRGSEGVRAAGFFGADWGVASGDWVWKPGP
jgi:predicted esterase